MSNPDYYVIVKVMEHDENTGRWELMSEKCRRYKNKKRAYALYDKLKMPRSIERPKEKRLF